jgi:hypothetical protein
MRHAMALMMGQISSGEKRGRGPRPGVFERTWVDDPRMKDYSALRGMSGAGDEGRRRRRQAPLALVGLGLAALIGCGSGATRLPDAGGPGGAGGEIVSPGNDALGDAEDGAGPSPSDADPTDAADAGTDTAAEPGTDAGTDANAEPGIDAGPEAGTDAASDAGVDAASDAGVDAPKLAPFSFFVTSLEAMQGLSESPIGFGGDLSFGETGEGAGLRGADKICATIAEQSMPGASAKQWRAFLSTTTGGPDGGAIDAIDRIGAGPWFDRMGRLVASNLTQLSMTRPGDADPAIRNDLPNELGIPNHTASAEGCVETACPDNHNTLTGTGKDGRLYRNDPAYTCNDWTSAEPSGRPWCGHSWPREGSGVNWMSAIFEGGCAPGVTGADVRGRPPDDHSVGAGGGYGGIYCFALSP